MTTRCTEYHTHVRCSRTLSARPKLQITDRTHGLQLAAQITRHASDGHLHSGEHRTELEVIDSNRCNLPLLTLLLTLCPLSTKLGCQVVVAAHFAPCVVNTMNQTNPLCTDACALTEITQSREADSDLWCRAPNRCMHRQKTFQLMLLSCLDSFLLSAATHNAQGYTYSAGTAYT